jgi:uncharacterized protein YcfJ
MRCAAFIPNRVPNLIPEKLVPKGLLNLLLGIGACVFATAAAAAAAAGSESYFVYADVLGVEPLIERRTVSEPHRSCEVVAPWRDGLARNPYDSRYRDHPRHRNGVATIIGGVIGGLVGSQFGGGTGRKALAITGAMLGASIANRARRHRHDSHSSHYTPQHCTTVVESHEVEEIAGYRVRYLYQGQEFVKRVDSDPGDRIRVQVQVTPVAEEPSW